MNCRASYFLKLSNHLTDVHELRDYYQQRQWLKKAMLQQKVKTKAGTKVGLDQLGLPVWVRSTRIIKKNSLSVQGTLNEFEFESL